MRAVTITNDLDAQLAALPKDEPVAIHLSGSLETKGVYMAGAFDSRNLGRGWTVDGDAEVALVSPVVDNQLLCLLAGSASSVKGLSLRGNHSKRPNALRTGGVWLDGDGELDHLTFPDFGARGKEAFVGVVANGSGQAKITNCRLTEFAPGSSDTQLTVFMIVGEYELALQEGNDTDAPEGWVQAHTIYRAKQGIVRGNVSKCMIGYYGDYFQSKNRLLTANKFTEALYGVQLQLSQTGEDGADPTFFCHEDYTIDSSNEIESRGPNIYLDTLGPATVTRYIRRISIDAKFADKIENHGAEIIITGFKPPPKTRHCPW